MSDWEKEFDERYGDYNSVKHTMEGIKSFIRTLLESERTKAYQEGFNDCKDCFVTKF